MRLSKLHNDYLSAMGITTWRLREQVPADHTDNLLHCYQLTHSKKITGMLFADVNSLDSQTDEERLLQAICRALEMTPQGQLLNVAENKEIVSNYQFVIAFGDRAEQYTLLNFTEENVILIHTYSLAELIKNPHLKAETWQALQPLLQLEK